MKKRALVILLAFIVPLIFGSPCLAEGKLKVLLVTGGHGFAREPFFKMFEDNKAITFTAAEHAKTNATVFDRDDLLSYSTVVLYDPR